MVRIFLVRHGQASFHAADYDQLSEMGAEQSRLLGEWFEHCGWPVHHIVLGGMKRHQQTAEEFFSRYTLAGDWRKQVVRNAGFNEFDHKDIFLRWLTANDPEALARGFQFGDMTPAEFNIKMWGALSRWAEAKHNDDYNEAWPAFSQRCVGAFESATALAKPGENVIAFTSGGTICAICRHVLGVSAEQMVRLIWEVMNGSVTCIAYKNGAYSLSTFNSTAHLDRTGRPELVTIK